MIVEDLNELVGMLTAAGVPATIDPKKLNPPGAWVHARRILGTRLDGELIIELGVHLVAPELDVPVALDKLESMLTITLEQVGHMVTDSDLGTTVTLPSGGTVPAFSLTLQPTTAL